MATSASSFDVASLLRDAPIMSSPLQNFLADPESASILSRPKKKKHHQDGSSPSRSASMLNRVLVEELEAQRFNSALRSAGDRLDCEARRAEEAELRARGAVARIRDVEEELHRAQLESTRAGEEIKRYQMQTTSLEREIQRMKEQMAGLKREKSAAEEGAARERETAKEYQMNLRDYEVAEEYKEKMQQMEAQQRYADGYWKGWEAGRSEGVKKGFREGREQGRAEEREYILSRLEASETDSVEEHLAQVRVNFVIGGHLADGYFNRIN
jgi:chromosome segregation ATPase